MKSLEFSGRFDALDGLRYFASLQVVLSHQSDARWQMRGTWADATMGFLDQRWAFSELFLTTFCTFRFSASARLRGTNVGLDTFPADGLIFHELGHFTIVSFGDGSVWRIQVPGFRGQMRRSWADIISEWDVFSQPSLYNKMTKRSWRNFNPNYS